MTPRTGSWSTSRTGTRYGFYHCQHGHRVSKANLEAAFLALLEALQPRPEYWALLKRIVLDVWRGRQRQARAQND